MDPIIGGALIGGALGFFGTRSSNQANENIASMTTAQNARQARLNRQFQSRETEKARDWETQMSNTAWRRGVRDMEKAGLNPMLAYSQGGAGTPNVGAPSGSTAQAVGYNYQNELGSMLSAAQQVAQVKLTEAQADNVKEDTVLKGTVSNLNRAQEELTVWQQNQIREYMNQKLPAEVDRLIMQTKKDFSSIQEIARRIELLRSQESLTHSQAVSAFMALRKAYNEYVAEGSDWKQNVSPYLDDAGKVTNSAMSVIDRFMLRRNGRSSLNMGR